MVVRSEDTTPQALKTRVLKMMYKTQHVEQNLNLKGTSCRNRFSSNTLLAVSAETRVSEMMHEKELESIKTCRATKIMRTEWSENLNESE